jgi:hypothetical protein
MVSDVPGWLPWRLVLGGWLGGSHYFVRISFPVLVTRRTYSSPSWTMITSRAPCIRSAVLIRRRWDHGR